MKGKEGWKQDLLLNLQTKFDTTTLADNLNFRVVGVPFYNEDLTKDEVVSALENLRAE
jgi:type III restriction enzyme